MTWLVTGGSGFLGVHLLRRLSERGVVARSLDLAPLDVVLPGVEVVVGDVRDERLVRESMAGIDVVVHAAAVLPSGGDLDGVNASGTASLARAAREARVRRSVFVSSAVVYGLQAAPVSEAAPTDPIEAYGRSKVRAEEAWLATAPAPLVLRPSAFIGPERLGVFGILFRWIREGRRIYVLGNGNNHYQLLDVDDLVRAIEHAGRQDGDGAINLGGTVSGTVREDLETLIRHAGTRCRVVGIPAAPAKAVLAMLDVARLSPLQTWHRRSADQELVFDCTKASEVLGWAPERSGAEALVRAYDWYCASGSGRPSGISHRSAWRERALGLVRRVS